MVLGEDLEGDTEEEEKDHWVPCHGHEEKKHATKGGGLFEIDGT